VRNEKVKRTIPFVIFGLGLVATLMLFLPGLHYEGTNYSGFEIAFGTSITADEPFFDGSRLTPNSYAIAAYFSPLVAGIVTLVLRNGNLFSLAMFVVAAVLFFLLPDYVDVVHIDGGEEIIEDVTWKHAYGIIIAAFACVVAALAEMLHISMTEKRD